MNNMNLLTTDIIDSMKVIENEVIKLKEKFPEGLPLEEYMNHYYILDVGYFSYLDRIAHFLRVNEKIQQAPGYISDLDIDFKNHKLGITIIQGLNRKNGSGITFELRFNIPFSHKVTGYVNCQNTEIDACDLLSHITGKERLKSIYNTNTNIVFMLNVKEVSSDVALCFNVSESESWTLTIPKGNIYLPPSKPMTEYEEYHFFIKFKDNILSEDILKEVIEI